MNSVYGHNKDALDELLQDIELSIKEKVKGMIPQLEKESAILYKKALIATLYSRIGSEENADPSYYRRTKQLIDSVRSQYVDGVIYIYHDYDSMYYESVTGINVTEQVPFWVNDGHGGLWDYEGRFFLEKAKEYMDEEFRELGVTVEIFKNKPLIV